MSVSGLTCVEDTLWCVVSPTGDPTYDFSFEEQFACRHPWQLDGQVRAVARMGAASDYAQRYHNLREQGVELIHTPEEYRRTSELPVWYPLIDDLTPRSVWFEQLPPADQIEDQFDWPVFLKGERQTSRHQRRLSIIESRRQFEEVMSEWQRDPILAWQRVVCREYVPLRRIDTIDTSHNMPRSFEFRSFWWNNRCVGIGEYWVAEHYKPTDDEMVELLKTAQAAVDRIDVTFLVVDVAQTAEGDWIVIEVNDGQDSGYGGVPRRAMWQHIVDIERSA